LRGGLPRQRIAPATMKIDPTRNSRRANAPLRGRGAANENRCPIWATSFGARPPARNLIWIVALLLSCSCCRCWLSQR
jgi:hypothetical protein